MKFEKLGDLCFMQSGGTPRRGVDNYYGGDIPWVKIGDMDLSEGKPITRTKENITEEGLKSINNRLFEKGTLLIAMYGSVGKTAIAGTNLSTNQAILGISIKDERKLDIMYLKIWFDFNRLKILGQARGATLQNISATIVKNFLIPLPPLSEQKRIAEILDKADALRKKNKQLLAAYDELLQATFLDMFGDPATNPKGWKKILLARVITDIVGGSSFGGEQRELQEDEFGVLKISSVTTGTFISTEYKAISSKRITKPIITPRKGDLLFSRANTREMVGAVAIVDNDYERLFLPDKLWRIDLNKKEASQFYLHKLLTNDRFRPELTKVATGTSGSMLNISKAKLNRLPIPLPPIALQNQFAQIVENIEAQKTLVKQSLQESEDLFNGLVQKAFSGEL